MSAILLLPLVLILGGPFMFGVVIGATKLHTLLRKGFSAKTSFIATLCVLAACAGLMTAPYWVLGTTGYLLMTGVYVLFVGIGATKFRKFARFLKRELDSDNTNDIEIPEDK
ncbi:MAG: hypothetical protein K8F91_27365 [Candidatus Obscuribacterales bacterium]|nr:hypothetical protein [Candidatus Obscuribacterales bacterium]